MERSIDFDEVADLYDTYTDAGFDLQFFRNEGLKCKGKVLELTSGTGRVSMPLLRAGVNLTCVDYSSGMLSVLRRKIEAEGLTCGIHLMDMRELALPDCYDLILIPFHSLSEVADRIGRKQVLERIRRHLTETGEAIITAHNPVIRIRTIDDTRRIVGTYPMKDGRSLTVLSILKYDPVSLCAEGYQLYNITDIRGQIIEQRKLDIRFCLFTREDFEDIIRLVGLDVSALYGTYDYADFDEQSSPYMIWKLRPRAHDCH